MSGWSANAAQGAILALRAPLSWSGDTMGAIQAMREATIYAP
jgi:hypothetical protein